MAKENKSPVARGVVWSGIERFSVQGIHFILSFVIARQLLPSDYGLIAMLSIFMAIAQSFIDSGFSNALIQKQDRTNIDYSTVFYFNVVVAVVMYLLFLFSAPWISAFYNAPLLTSIITWVGLNFIISSLATVQRAKLTIELNFKLQAYISIVAVVVSGSMAVWMAYNGYGVWTLVYQGLVSNAVTVLLLWLTAHWIPLRVFSWKSFKELFGFGSKLLAGGLLHTIYTNMYTLVIGKFFNAVDLGYFSRASSITQYPSTNITNIVTRVTYPVECQLQHDNDLLQQKYFSFIRCVSFIVFPMMAGLAVLCEPFIRIVLTDKWLGAVPYAQILCAAYMWDPIMRMTWDLLNVKHRSDYSLKSEIIKKITAFCILFVTIPFGVKVMCMGLILYALADLFIITRFVKKVLPSVTLSSIIRELVPILLLSGLMGCVVSGFLHFMTNLWLELLGGLVIGCITYVGGAYLFRFRELKMIFQIFKIK
ncbi:MAG: oligosaccharide flippase family protein [Bacteroidaceae bacterium]|jgi:teichuronic acid exporter